MRCCCSPCGSWRGCTADPTAWPPADPPLCTPGPPPWPPAGTPPRGWRGCPSPGRWPQAAPPRPPPPPPPRPSPPRRSGGTGHRHDTFTAISRRCVTSQQSCRLSWSVKPTTSPARPPLSVSPSSAWNWHVLAL